MVEVEAAREKPLVDTLLVAGRQYYHVGLELRVDLPAVQEVADLDLPQHGKALGAEMMIVRTDQPLPTPSADVVDPGPYIGGHVQAAAEHRRLELASLANGGIPALIAIPQDAVAFRRAPLSCEQRRMPARNAGAHGFDAQILYGLRGGIVCASIKSSVVSIYHNSPVGRMGESEWQAWLDTTHSIDFVAQGRSLHYKPTKISNDV